jgi:hypothetical protein
VEVGRTASSYKPGPQGCYLVDRMSDFEKTLLEAISKLSEKFDLYDKRLTYIGSDVSKVQALVDLLMRSIQALQKEQILLVRTMQGSSGSGHQGASDLGGPMGASPTSPTPAPPVHAHASSSTNGLELETRRHWMPKMEFPRFDGSDVRIWLDKYSAYF